MSEINLSEDTEEIVKALLQLCESIMWRYKVESGDMIIDSDTVTLDTLDTFIMEASSCVHSFLTSMENKYGGGYIDVGPSKALGLLAEGNLSNTNLQTLFLGYQVIINKLVLMDSGRTGQEHLTEFSSICSQYSGKGEAA